VLSSGKSSLPGPLQQAVQVCARELSSAPGSSAAAVGPLSSRVAQGQDQGLRRFFSALAAENFAAWLAPIWIG
jgi:hypothetical protein